jgi:hypothetical protein
MKFCLIYIQKKCHVYMEKIPQEILCIINKYFKKIS